MTGLIDTIATRALSAEEIASLLEWLIAGASADEAAPILVALARRGETPAELASFAGWLRERAVDPGIAGRDWAGGLIDLCGTGGDGRQFFNVSTGATFVAAGAGVCVAKHGNRGITSKSGAFDVLECLGIRTGIGVEATVRCLKDAGLGFFFAPLFHPVMAKVAPVRKRAAEMGSRTVFNLIGPLLNPARPTAQLIGVMDRRWARGHAEAMRTLGLSRGMVVSGRTPDGSFVDEVSVLGATHVVSFEGCNEVSESEWQGTETGDVADLIVSSPEESAARILDVLSGRDRSIRRAMIEANASAALMVAGRAATFEAGRALAAATLDGGHAMKKLEEVRAAVGR